MSNDVAIDTSTANFARTSLLNWFEAAARVFPWRYDTNPYHVLIAEMMLRRTQARQVVPTYNKFIHVYPDIYSLDSASDKEIADILYPLGLAWRAENFKILAHEIVLKHNGEVPRNRLELLSLTGIGPYVSEAVRGFAFNEPSVIIDTNTVRVAARYFGFDYNPESRRRKVVIQAVASLSDPDEPMRLNYALLDFAATVCRAKNPLHKNCPLAPYCTFYKTIQTEQE